MTLGERIYKFRAEKEMSQGDLADALGVSRQSISKWETNSSVPELDKLVKLSEIFGISLDELITGKETEQQGKREEPEAAPPQPEPKIFYVEKPVMPAISAVQILGIILILGSLMCFVVFDDLQDALFLCLPVAIWGVLCLVTRHPLLWCSWCGSVTWWVYMFILAHRWETQTLFLIIGILLVGAALAYTIYLGKKKRIHISVWGWGLLGIVLVAALILLLINVVPPFPGSVTTPSEVHSIVDASVGE